MVEEGDRLKVAFAIPQNGWVELRVNTAENEFRDVVSYTPNDFVLELATALSLAIQGVNGEAVACCEPTTYVLTFSPAPNTNELRFQIIKYPDWQRRPRSGCTILSLQASIIDVVSPFWRALRALEGAVPAAEYREGMRRAFPSSCVEKLSQLLSEQRP